MLILERRPGESLSIGDEIRLTVLSVGEGGKVQLGISAPRDVLILRSELQQARTENRDAAETPITLQEVEALEDVLLHALPQKPQTKKSSAPGGE